jgi:hypothetical protein
VELAREAPVEADLVCPVPDSGTPAAIGYSQESGIPYAMGIIRNQYMGRTFIEPTEQIRNMGVRLKLNVNRALIKGKRVILVDDSVVRGTTSRKIKDMILEAGAAEVHFRIASPPTAWPCFYGVDTPERSKLLAATMSEDEMRDWIGVDSLRFISLDGPLPRRGRGRGPRPAAPQYCDACFSGDTRSPLGQDRGRLRDEGKGRECRAKEAAGQATVRGPAGKPGHADEADQEARRRAHHVGNPGVTVRKHRQAHRPFGQVDDQCRRAEACAERQADDQDRERLERHRHREHWNADLGSERNEERPSKDERETLERRLMSEGSGGKGASWAHRGSPEKGC